MDEYLLSVWRDAAREIAQRALRMATESNYRRAFSQLVRIREILDELDRESARYVEKLILQVYKEADAKAIRLLSSQGKIDLITSFSIVNERAVRFITEGTLAELRAATGGMKERAETFFQQTRLEATLDDRIRKRLAVETAKGTGREAIGRRLSDELRQTFEDGIVRITTRTGRPWEFQADYYAGMIAQSGRRQAMTQATILRTIENGVDLVVVSNNFSIVEDFCDSMRGRIYSVSGTHPLAPPLAALPNGGPPLHVNCRHSIQPWVAQFYPEGETFARSQTDPRFLYVDAREAQRRWERLGAMEQARLRHAVDQRREQIAVE